MNIVAKPSAHAGAQKVAPHVNYAEQSPELLKKFTESFVATRESSIEKQIRDLVAIRAAQLNGCNFCLDLYVKQAKIHGELCDRALMR